MIAYTQGRLSDHRHHSGVEHVRDGDDYVSVSVMRTMIIALRMYGQEALTRDERGRPITSRTARRLYALQVSREECPLCSSR